MKYEITFRQGKEEATKEIEADDATVRGGFLYLTSSTGRDERVHGIFADWNRIVETKE